MPFRSEQEAQGAPSNLTELFLRLCTAMAGPRRSRRQAFLFLHLNCKTFYTAAQTRDENLTFGIKNVTTPLSTGALRIYGQHRPVGREPSPGTSVNNHIFMLPHTAQRLPKNLETLWDSPSKCGWLPFHSCGQRHYGGWGVGRSKKAEPSAVLLPGLLRPQVPGTRASFLCFCCCKFRSQEYSQEWGWVGLRAQIFRECGQKTVQFIYSVPMTQRKGKGRGPTDS